MYKELGNLSIFRILDSVWRSQAFRPASDFAANLTEVLIILSFLSVRLSFSGIVESSDHHGERLERSPYRGEER